MLFRLPFLSLLVGVLGALMLVPTIMAATQGDWKSSRSFLYAAIFVLVASAAIRFVSPAAPARTARRELAVLLFGWVFLPIFAAIPLTMVTPAIGLVGAWFEMTAALTTTGGTVYGSLAAVPDAVHLWRGMVGWAGGLMTLVAAYAILAPRRLGGFEIEASTLRGPGRENDQVVSLSATTPALASRLSRAARVIVPVYGLLTAGLAIIFNTLGQGGLESAVHAMSILSTSGISPVQGGLAAANSFSAEAVAALFLLITATPVLWSKASQTGLNVPWQRDPQLRMLLFLVGITTLALFARHWLGALTVDDSEPLSDAFTALWGNIFTTLSFLSTTGFESASWEASRNWSGLSNPGLFLLALATVGGGAATTAGGVKLIRAFALMRHGYREIERLAQPASIIGVGS
ncbi:MAG: potassium transporter TrkG, partial [Pseudomonadota bacterium]